MLREDLLLSLPERPCCREVMLREGLRLSLPGRPCYREVMHPRGGYRTLSAALRGNQAHALGFLGTCLAALEIVRETSGGEIGIQMRF